MNADILEQGNGLPEIGDYVPGNDGELYRIVDEAPALNTGRHAGQGMWYRAEVWLAEWDDVEDDDVFPALAILDDA